MVSLVNENISLPVQTLTFRAEDFFVPTTGFYDVPSKLEHEVSGYGFRLTTELGAVSSDGTRAPALKVYVRTVEDNLYDDFLLQEGERIAFLGYRQAIKL